jgi:hypothetical protein
MLIVITFDVLVDIPPVKNQINNTLWHLNGSARMYYPSTDIDEVPLQQRFSSSTDCALNSIIERMVISHIISYLEKGYGPFTANQQ